MREKKREVEAGGGIVRNHPSLVVFSIPLPGLHSLVSASAVAPSAGHAHPPSLRGPWLEKLYAKLFWWNPLSTLFKNMTPDITFRRETLTGTSADTQRLSATAAGVLEDSGKTSV